VERYAADSGLIRLEDEVREDRGAADADGQTPYPRRVIAVLLAIGYSQKNVARFKRVPHVVAQRAQPEEDRHQGNVHDDVWKKEKNGLMQSFFAIRNALAIRLSELKAVQVLVLVNWFFHRAKIIE